MTNRRSDLEPVLVGGHVVAYRPAKKKATQTAAEKAEDTQAVKSAEIKKES